MGFDGPRTLTVADIRGVEAKRLRDAEIRQSTRNAAVEAKRVRAAGARGGCSAAVGGFGGCATFGPKT